MPGANMQPKALAELMESEKVTLAAGVPDDLDGRPARARGPRPVSALRDIVCGGSAVPQSLSEAYREKIGLPILQAWGMTETSPVATTGRIKSTLLDRSEDELADLRAAQGIAIPLVELRIVDPAATRSCRGTARRAASCRPTGRGSRAPTTTTSARPTRSPTTAGCSTGDVATISPNGYVRLVDRTKDLVKSGGEWISSVELENAIMAHPKVAEAAVIGIPDEKWSERPLACVVPDGDEEITLDELKEFLAERVPKWWIPNDMEIIDEVPKTSVGQVLEEDAARAVRGAQDHGLTVDRLGSRRAARSGQPRACFAVLLGGRAGGCPADVVVARETESSS